MRAYSRGWCLALLLCHSNSVLLLTTRLASGFHRPTITKIPRWRTVNRFFQQHQQPFLKSLEADAAMNKTKDHESTWSAMAAVAFLETPHQTHHPTFVTISNQSRKEITTHENYSVTVLGFVAACVIAALLLLAWEDVTCSYVLPSRSRVYTATKTPRGFAQVTIRGMGFGTMERQKLEYVDAATQELPSYNEVLWMHRQERVPRWKASSTFSHEDATPNDAARTQEAIHTILECLSTISQLQELARHYDWNNVRTLLHAEPLATQLEVSASMLRATAPSKDAATIIGFDWGSCAWRHCGALADAQEALDELDALLGVLEPPEALFCLDIVERSLRDILSSVDWTIQASEQDVRAWKQLPEYVPYQSMRSDDAAQGGLDEEYLKAIQELRID